MSEPTVIDAEYIERERTIEERLQEVEQLAKMLLEAHKIILEHLNELASVVAENITVLEEE